MIKQACDQIRTDFNDNLTVTNMALQAISKKEPEIERKPLSKRPLTSNPKRRFGRSVPRIRPIEKHQEDENELIQNYEQLEEVFKVADFKKEDPITLKAIEEMHTQMDKIIQLYDNRDKI